MIQQLAICRRKKSLRQGPNQLPPTFQTQRTFLTISSDARCRPIYVVSFSLCTLHRSLHSDLALNHEHVLVCPLIEALTDLPKVGLPSLAIVSLGAQALGTGFADEADGAPIHDAGREE